MGENRKTWGLAIVIPVLIIALVTLSVFLIKDLNKTPAAEANESNISREITSEPEGEPNDSRQESGNLSESFVVPSFKRTDAMTIADVAAKAAPSVVEITTETVTTGSNMRQYISSGAGSGVIIREDGYLLTNNHVIEGASNITVTLNSGESYPAKLIGLDENQDVALLKIDAEGLAAAEIGTSADLIVGQEVVAIGNPLGQLGGSVTNGIISALNRNITIDSRTMNLMQTNAAINPGNSGGGLFDASGRLIGIVVAKYADSEIEGLGFVIPIDDAMAILEDLYEFGYVRGKASLGLSLLEITSRMQAWMYGVNYTGVYINSVSKGSAADEAGLRAGDLIVTVAGKKIETTADLEAITNGLNVDDVITLQVYRNGQTVNAQLTVGEYIPQQVREARYAD